MYHQQMSQSDKLIMKPIKDRVYWSIKANKLFKETHQRIGSLEENRMLFYLIKYCTVQTDHPYVRFQPKSVSLKSSDLPDDPDLLKDILRKISNHSFWIRQAEGESRELLTSWIDDAIYDQKTAEFVVILSPVLYPYITSLHDRFQTSDYERAQGDVHLKSKYSSRLYEVLRIHEKFHELPLTLEQLRYLMDVGDGKLERWVDLKRRVIDPAVDEINETGHFKISYAPVKSGRSVATVRFTIEQAVRKGG
ncbi:replication initiation protein [Sporolactobacillus sp. KGMB 08714]|uniref:replication initiation protein n=1 Tax=Sporolactobacillus sp. KGMB 08714 TaxID=3064704 RepID=UPI002FBE9DE1